MRQPRCRCPRCLPQTTTAAKQKELTDAAMAALDSAKIAGSWSAVKDASAHLTTSASSGSWSAVKDASLRLGRTASSAGLAKVASLIAETASRGVAGGGGEQPARQIPVLEQQQPQPAPEPAAAQGQAQRLRQIPVIDLASLDQQAAAVAAGAAAGAAAGQPGGVACPPAAAQQAPEQVQAGEVVVPCFDAQMADAAAAQQAASGSGSGDALASAGGSGGGSGGSPGNPEHLYPPGRIIW